MLTHNRLVHIRISDTGWILERLARELSDRLPYVSYDLDEDSAAAIQYYMTYGCRERRVSPIEVGFFTHKESDAEAAKRFVAVAKDVDRCIAMSPATESILIADGISSVEMISPGVDLDRFQPKIRIGVVGRTYHTGRKGEDLIAQVMDIPQIEWQFTGPGWPGPCMPVADDEMPEFYRSLDYLLVPALNEGGPMPVLEALASGCPVIAAPVGWVPRFPHTPFKTGDAADLRRVLQGVVNERQALRDSVANETWEKWAHNHNRVFSDLLGRNPLDPDSAIQAIRALSTAESHNTRAQERVVVAVHGEEASKSLGGPSVRAPRTATALRRIGVDARFSADRRFTAADTDLLHVFNVWPPNSCRLMLKQAELQRVTSVLSPIFLDLSERPIFHDAIPAALERAANIEQAIAAVVSLGSEGTQKGPVEPGEPFPGYFADIRRLAKSADHLVLLSEHEREKLAEIGVNHPSTTLVKNPVDAGKFADADPSLFEEAYGLSDFVLCVGRIESRKNQAMLALALRDEAIPLVFVGHEADSRYAAIVRKWAGPNVLFAGRIEPGSSMLASCLAAARVFCLPSWSEGAPLAALEAAAAGCNLVLSDRSAEREYFGDLAKYVDPGNPLALRDEVLASYRAGRDPDNSEELRSLVVRENSWETYAMRTATAYQSALQMDHQQSDPSDGTEQRPRRIFVDLTTSAHYSGHATGIARAEEQIGRELRFVDAQFDIRYVIWLQELRAFIEVSASEADSLEIRRIKGARARSRLVDPLAKTPFAQVDFQREDYLVTFGGAWLRNQAYRTDLRSVKDACGLSLISTVYDVIPAKLGWMYPSEIGAEFSQAYASIIEMSDTVLTCSEASARDIVDLCLDNQVPVPPIEVFRLGDSIDFVEFDTPPVEDAAEVLQDDRGFVLYVSSLDIRKNHTLLFAIWQRLVAEYGSRSPRLVLVGRDSWRSGEVLNELKAMKTLDGDVLLLRDVDDAALKWLYEHCMFTVYTSFCEGWGLPVAESLRHGKFCIASNAGSLGEVAPTHAEYIDPRDFVGWYKAIVRYVSSPGLRQLRDDRARTFSGTAWSSSARSVLHAIRHSSSHQDLAKASVGVTYSFGHGGDASRQDASPFVLAGFDRAEATARWSLGRTAVIGMNLNSSDVKVLAMKVSANGYSPDGAPVTCIVKAGGQTVAHWSAWDRVALQLARIPSSSLDASGNVVIEFQISQPRSPRDVEGGNDERMLGLRLRSISFEKVLSLPSERWIAVSNDCRDPFVVDVETVSHEPRHLVLEFESTCSTPVEIRTNDGGAVSARVGGTDGRRYLSVCGSWTGPIAVSVGSPRSDQARVVRVGLFSTLPQVVSDDLLASGRRNGPLSNTAAGPPLTHVAFGGAPPLVRIDEELPTCQGSASMHGLAGDWREPEEDGVWVGREPATIWIMPGGDLPDTFSVKLRIYPLSWLAHMEARYEVLIGQTERRVLYLGKPEGYGDPTICVDIRVSKAETVDDQGRIPITLACESAATPVEVGLGVDGRVLSLMVRSVELSSVSV